MDAQQWEPIARRIEAAWPDTPMTPQRSEIYLEVLGDLDATHVATAVNALLREGREEPPPPGVVRERAMAVARAGAGEHAGAPPPRRGRVSPVWIVLGVLAVAAVAIIVVVLVVNATGGDDATTTDAPVTITQTTTAPAPSTDVAPTVPTEPTVPSEPAATAPTTDAGGATDAVP